MAVDGFAQPWWLLLLLVVAAIVVGYLWSQRRRRRAVLRFANLATLERVAPRQPGWPRHVPAALLCLGLILLVVGLAGPTAETQVSRNRATVILVMDVSLSMRSTDVAPSRLAAAQDAATRFAQSLPPTINLGLESFAGTPAVLVPPSTERDPVVRQIRSLKLSESTATGEAIAAAINAIDTFNSAVPGGDDGPPPARIVLMSDGKQVVGRDEFQQATEAARRHIPISTVSFGTEGGVVHIDGQDVPVPVDDASLAKVAQMSGGEFFPARSNTELHQVYDTLRSQIGFETVHADVSRPWLATGTLLCLVAAGIAVARSQRLPV
ncbi:MAG TPA: VWA domain-containing protein [Pseudonocardia sp.]|jgi:Ca-activated chloride channel family protein